MGSSDTLTTVSSTVSYNKMCIKCTDDKIKKEVHLDEFGIGITPDHATDDDDDDDLAVDELGVALDHALDIQDLEDYVVDDPNSSVDDEIEILAENVQNGCSLDEHSAELASSGNPSNHVETRKVVSAMKGSRAQRGIMVQSELRVKWAPDVYDPPVTSDSHTVKRGHHRQQHSRPSTKKDYYNYYKHKGSKNKTSHSKSSSSDRKHSHHSSKSSGRSSSSSKSIDPHLLSMQAGHGKSGLNKAGSGGGDKRKELEYTSSFCMDPLASTTLHVPLTEAS